MKQCSKCGNKKSVADFSRNSKNKDGLSGYCRECKRRQNEAYKFMKARRSPEYIHRAARKAATDALYG